LHGEIDITSKGESVSESGFTIICLLLAILLNRIRARWIKQGWLRIVVLILMLLLIYPALNMLYMTIKQQFL
jgi:hypothetical protein